MNRLALRLVALSLCATLAVDPALALAFSGASSAAVFSNRQATALCSQQAVVSSLIEGFESWHSFQPRIRWARIHDVMGLSPDHPIFAPPLSPRIRTQFPEGLRSSDQNPSAIGSGLHESKTRLLVLDDSEPLLRALSSALENGAPQFSARLHWVNPGATDSAHDLISVLLSFSPEQVLIDYHMHQAMSGLDAARIVRDLFPHIPIVLWSAEKDLSVLRGKAAALGLADGRPIIHSKATGELIQVLQGAGHRSSDIAQQDVRLDVDRARRIAQAAHNTYLNAWMYPAHAPLSHLLDAMAYIDEARDALLAAEADVERLERQGRSTGAGVTLSSNIAGQTGEGVRRLFQYPLVGLTIFVAMAVVYLLPAPLAGLLILAGLAYGDKLRRQRRRRMQKRQEFQDLQQNAELLTDLIQQYARFDLLRMEYQKARDVTKESFDEAKRALDVAEKALLQFNSQGAVEFEFAKMLVTYHEGYVRESVDRLKAQCVELALMDQKLKMINGRFTGSATPVGAPAASPTDNAGYGSFVDHQSIGSIPLLSPVRSLEPEHWVPAIAAAIDTGYYIEDIRFLFPSDAGAPALPPHGPVTIRLATEGLGPSHPHIPLPKALVIDLTPTTTWGELQDALIQGGYRRGSNVSPQEPLDIGRKRLKKVLFGMVILGSLVGWMAWRYGAHALWVLPVIAVGIAAHFSTGSGDHGPSISWDEVRKEVEAQQIDDFMKGETRDNEVREYTDLADWIEPSMTVQEVMLGMVKRRSPARGAYEHHLFERIRLEAVRKAATGTRITGVSRIQAELIYSNRQSFYADRNIFYNIDAHEHNITSIIFRKEDGAGTYVLHRNGTTLYLIAEGDPTPDRQGPRGKVNDVLDRLATLRRRTAGRDFTVSSLGAGGMDSLQGPGQNSVKLYPLTAWDFLSDALMDSLLFGSALHALSRGLGHPFWITIPFAALSRVMTTFRNYEYQYSREVMQFVPMLASGLGPVISGVMSSIAFSLGFLMPFGHPYWAGFLLSAFVQLLFDATIRTHVENAIYRGRIHDYYHWTISQKQPQIAAALSTAA